MIPYHPDMPVFNLVIGMARPAAGRMHSGEHENLPRRDQLGGDVGPRSSFGLSNGGGYFGDAIDCSGVSPVAIYLCGFPLLKYPGLERSNM